MIIGVEEGCNWLFDGISRGLGLEPRKERFREGTVNILQPSLDDVILCPRVLNSSFSNV